MSSFSQNFRSPLLFFAGVEFLLLIVNFTFGALNFATMLLTSPPSSYFGSFFCATVPVVSAILALVFHESRPVMPVITGAISAFLYLNLFLSAVYGTQYRDKQVYLVVLLSFLVQIFFLVSAILNLLHERLIRFYFGPDLIHSGFPSFLYNVGFLVYILIVFWICLYSFDIIEVYKDSLSQPTASFLIAFFPCYTFVFLLFRYFFSKINAKIWCFVFAGVCLILSIVWLLLGGAKMFAAAHAVTASEEYLNAGIINISAHPGTLTAVYVTLFFLAGPPFAVILYLILSKVDQKRYEEREKIRQKEEAIRRQEEKAAREARLREEEEQAQRGALFAEENYDLENNRGRYFVEADNAPFLYEEQKYRMAEQQEKEGKYQVEESVFQSTEPERFYVEETREWDDAEDDEAWDDIDDDEDPDDIENEEDWEDIEDEEEESADGMFPEDGYFEKEEFDDELPAYRPEEHGQFYEEETGKWDNMEVNEDWDDIEDDEERDDIENDEDWYDPDDGEKESADELVSEDEDHEREGFSDAWSIFQDMMKPRQVSAEELRERDTVEGDENGEDWHKSDDGEEKSADELVLEDEDHEKEELSDAWSIFQAMMKPRQVSADETREWDTAENDEDWDDTDDGEEKSADGMFPEDEDYEKEECDDELDEEIEEFLSDDEDIVFTLVLEDGSSTEVSPLLVFQMDGVDYIALIPIDETADAIYLYRYILHEETDIEFVPIRDEQEFQKVEEEFHRQLGSSDI